MAWTTIESDPGVFHALVRDCGVEGVSFSELWSLEPETFESLKPIHGLFFLFKYQSRGATAATNTTAAATAAQQPPPHNLFFAHQVIPNACATLALLHVLLNAEGVDCGPVLSGFRAFTDGMEPALRGHALGQCDAVRLAHNSFARPEPFLHEERVVSDDDEAFHFVAYVEKAGRVWELDGLAAAPVDLGAAPRRDAGSSGGDGGGGGTDWLSVATPVIQARIAEYSSQEIRFNLLALCCDPLAAARRAAGAALGQLRAAHAALQPTDAGEPLASDAQLLLAAGVALSCEDVDAGAAAAAQAAAAASLVAAAAGAAAGAAVPGGAAGDAADDGATAAAAAHLHDVAAGALATAAAAVHAAAEQQALWAEENARRRHNYVPLLMELLQQAARAGQLRALYEAGRKKAAAVREAQRARKASGAAALQQGAGVDYGGAPAGGAS